MEIEKNTRDIVVVDACTLINLANIDSEDDFLWKQLNSYLSVILCEKVFEETKDHIKDKTLKSAIPDKTDKERALNFLDKRIALIARHLRVNSSITDDLGNDFFDKCKSFFYYSKNNGEFFSSVLSLYLSRLNERKVLFCTDDNGAIEELNPYFRHHQIGTIEDSADLLSYLFWLSSEFTEDQLIKFLHDLRAEYLFEVDYLIDRIRNYRDNTFNARKGKLSVREGNFRNIVSRLEEELSKYNFAEVRELLEELPKFRKEHSDIVNIILNSTKLCELASNGMNSYLQKITGIINNLKEKREIYKIA